MGKIDSHDTVFKEIESIKENAADFIRGVFPPQLTARLDLESLVLDNTSYTDETLKKSFSDLVYNCTYKKKQPIKVALLFEHKSYAPEYPHFQLLKYMLKIWAQQIKKKETVTPVIPVIFYHGQKQWESLDFNHYFGDVDEELAAYVPAFQYILTDTAVYSDELIKEKLFQRTANRILFLLMKYIFKKSVLPEVLPEIFAMGKSYYENEEGENFLKSILMYILQTTEIDSNDIIQILKNISLRGGDIAMSTATKLRKEGINEGKIEGKIEAAKKMLQKGYSLEEIADITGLTPREIKKINIKENHS